MQSIWNAMYLKIYACSFFCCCEKWCIFYLQQIHCIWNAEPWFFIQFCISLLFLFFYIFYSEFSLFTWILDIEVRLVAGNAFVHPKKEKWEVDEAYFHEICQNWVCKRMLMSFFCQFLPCCMYTLKFASLD